MVEIRRVFKLSHKCGCGSLLIYECSQLAPHIDSVGTSSEIHILRVHFSELKSGIVI